jgi:hypothetical protein
MHRFLLLAAGFSIGLALTSTTASAAPPSAVAGGLKSTLETLRVVEPVCRGCGCRGGPGYRLPNGKCASWGRRR